MSLMSRACVWYWIVWHPSGRRGCCGLQHSAVRLSSYVGHNRSAAHQTIFWEIFHVGGCESETPWWRQAALCFSSPGPWTSMPSWKTHFQVALLNAKVYVVALPICSLGASLYTWAISLGDHANRWSCGLPFLNALGGPRPDVNDDALVRRHGIDLKQLTGNKELLQDSEVYTPAFGRALVQVFENVWNTWIHD